MAIDSGVWGPPVVVGGTAAGLSGTFGRVFFWEASFSHDLVSRRATGLSLEASTAPFHLIPACLSGAAGG